jgi:hypothetical protein
MENMSEYPISAYARDVEPGQTAQFKTVLPVSKAATYRFDGISGF